MKKIVTILSLVVISIIFIAGCSSSKNSDKDKLYIGNCPDAMFGMGKKYYINNLEDGNYEIEFTAKEYEYGVLKEEHVLYKSIIEHNGKNSTLKIGVIDGDDKTDYNLNAIINDSQYECDNVEFLKDGFDTGIVISILEEDKYFNLDNEVPIAIYSIGGENNTTESLNIDKEFEIGNNNLKDLVVYVKLHKIN